MLNLKYEASLACRYLAGAKGQGTFSLLTILALLGTLMGVASLVIGQAISTGVQQNAQDVLVTQEPHLWVEKDMSLAHMPSHENLSTLGFSAEDLEVLGLSGGFSLDPPEQPWLRFDEDVMGRLDSVDRLVGIYPVLETDVFLKVGDQFNLNALRGVNMADLQNRGVSLRTEPKAQDWSLIVPNQLLWSGDFALGDRVTLVTTQLQVTPIGRLPLVQDFNIVATYPGSADGPLLTTLATAQLLLSAENHISVLELYVQDPFNLNVVREALLSFPENVRVESWQERRSNLASFLSILRLVMFVILSLILLVAAFNIFAGQLLLTDAQRRSIAFMRSAGFSKNSILRVFLFAGLLIGGGGTLVGLVVGSVLALNFPLLIQLGIPGLSFFETSLPIVRGVDLILIFGLALGLNFGAALLPAWTAASTPPAEAISLS